MLTYLPLAHIFLNKDPKTRKTFDEIEGLIDKCVEAELSKRNFEDE